MAITVIIADDHEIVRSGLSALLDVPEIKIVGEADGGDAAIRLVTEKQPDVLLMDVRMDHGDGLDSLDKIREASPNTRVVMLTTFDSPTYMARAAALGAVDYLLKGASQKQLVKAITSAASGAMPLREQLHKMANKAPDKQIKDDVPLTTREGEVLRHMALGLSNKEIARALEISVDTVKEHVQNVLRKLEAVDRTQAAVWAVRRGLV